MRLKIDSLNELPEDKKPPRDLWYKSYKLKQWLNDVFNIKTEVDRNFVELNLEDVE
jgi:hypothetical protein